MGERERRGTCRLIVNADDYGKSPEANRAIERAVREGILTSTTVMANMPYYEEIAGLKSACPWVSIGLHVNLTSGRPVLPPETVPSLVDSEGNFLSTNTFVYRVWLGRIAREHMRAEIEAQLERLKKAAGSVSHFDSHHHIHSRSPQVLDAMLQAGKSHGLTRVRTNRRYYIDSTEQNRGELYMKLSHFAESPLAIPVQPLNYLQQRSAATSGFSMPDCILTPVPAIPSKSPIQAVHRWARVLRHAPAGTFELIFHPGGGPQYEGQEELLCHPELRAAVAERDVQLVNYSAVS
jgi:predicted glycoside hydrolase/deacetylase ChbG (UPF0249 family)